MRKLLDNLLTGIVLSCLVFSAYISYYLRPWRWLPAKRAGHAAPDNPYANIPLPDTADGAVSKPAENTEKAAA